MKKYIVESRIIARVNGGSKIYNRMNTANKREKAISDARKGEGFVRIVGIYKREEKEDG